MERKLVVCEGPSRGVEHVLVPGRPVTIGRSKEATVQVDDPAVSRVHCEIVPQGEFWVVRDLDSRNHVFVGKRVTQEHVLEDGDVFRLGKNTAVRFRVHDSTREVPAARPAPGPAQDDRTVEEAPGRPRVAVDGVSLVGRALGEFRVAEKVGVSGAATCYRAIQPSLNRNVLLQVYPPALGGDPAFRERLLNEVRAVSPLLHPCILQLFDLEEEAGRLFLVLEWFKGVTLADYLADKSFLPIRSAIELTVQLCDALAYAAEQQWIVTEVQPRNVLIDPRPTAKLMLLRDPSATPGDLAEFRDQVHLAPELLSPNRTGDIRSAIYSLGTILYRCVGGMPPHQSEDPDELKARILKDPPRDLKKLNIRASDGLCAIVGRALEKHPQNRPQTPAEFARELKKLVSRSGR